MIEGLWTVQFVGVQGDGGGVVVFTNGKVLGGDTGYTYIGTYSVVDNAVSAQVKVSNFMPTIPNVLGLRGDFELQIKAPLSGTSIQGSMSLVGMPGAGIAVKLVKKTNL